MNFQHTKVLNTNNDVKNRFRFVSSRKRAQQTSADVYRSYKRRVGIVTSASSREEQVHHAFPTTKTKKDSENVSEVLPLANKPSDDDAVTSDQSNFAVELDIASDRNASEIFTQFYHEIWHLVRSLPEILHHSEKIIDLLLFYMLSPETAQEKKLDSNEEDFEMPDEELDKMVEIEESHKKDVEVKVMPAKSTTTATSGRQAFMVNQATTDILHLIGVLARDMRHEIHPYVHTKIIPRILTDLLNPPLPPPDSGKQPIPLDVAIVEAAFRTLSYIFRYDADPLLTEESEISCNENEHISMVVSESKSTTKKTEPCLERMRQYYGMTLANRRDLIRRLAAETFAGLIRKLKSDSSKRKHLRRVVKALAVASSASTSTKSHNELRLQQDAIDGIACLMFEVARGVPGQLHSKANSVVIKILLDFFLVDDNKEQKSKTKREQFFCQQEVTFSVVSAFMDRLCQHLQPANLGTVISTIIDYTKKSLLISKKGKEEKVISRELTGFVYYLKLVEQLVSYRDGIVLKHDEPGVVRKDLEALLEELLEKTSFVSFDELIQKAAVSLFCVTGKVLQGEPDFLRRMSVKIRPVLLQHSDKDNFLSLQSNPASMIMLHLMTLIPMEIAMQTFGSSLISAASEAAQQCPKLTLKIVYALSSLKWKTISSDTDIIDDSDDVFFLENAHACNISDEENQTLLKLFLFNIDANMDLMENVSYLTTYVQAASFMVLVGGADSQCKRLVSNYKKVSNWLIRLMRRIKDEQSYISDADENHASISILMSIAIACYGRLSRFLLDHLKSTDLITSRLETAQSIVEKHLISNSKSIWAVKSVAAFVAAMKYLNMTLNDSPNDIFDCLIPNLSSGSHFLRLHSLTILTNYANRPFVVNHAELDFSDDLDEEPSALAGENENNKTSLRGACSVMTTLLSIEATPIDIRKERHILSLINGIEVLGQSGKLPIVYAESAAAHMLGLLHVKFSPIWPAVVKAFVGLSKGHENCVWPCVYLQLVNRMNRFPFQDIKSADKTLPESRIDCFFDPKEKFLLMLKAARCCGSEVCLFADDISSAVAQGRVSRHQWADDGLILQSLWSIVEKANLMNTHSRELVPVFLRFMKLQYYEAYRDDPDGREIDVGDFLSVEDCVRIDPGRSLEGRAVLSRLISQLKVFNSVKGPQQLFKHHLLLPIFISLVGHPDTETAQLALNCVLRFKPPYLLQFSETVKDFFDNRKLRSAMMHFISSIESGLLDTSHRKPILNLLSRVLFGRLIARARRSKSSNFSPCSKRLAIIGFMSSICKDGDELYPFIFLMVRNYLPPTIPRKAIEEQSPSDRANILGVLVAISPDDCLKLPIQVHQGFLNVLEAVVSQLGHRITDYIPIFMAIILAIGKAFEIKDVTSLDKEACVDDGANLSDGNTDPGMDGKIIRIGAIRSLCYRRLIDIFSKFAETVDFQIYSDSLWDTLQQSLPILPATVVNSETIPSLLVLVRTMSNHHSLVKMLNDQVVSSVLKCLKDSSKPVVVDATLAFVENLISNEDSGSDSVGRTLVRKHIPLLLDQFCIRINCSSSCSLARDHSRKKATCTSTTLRRELKVLCSVTNLIDSDKLVISDEDNNVVERLCSLLMAFLPIRIGISDEERHNILNLSEKLVVKVSSEYARAQYFSTLAELLGPFKARPGLTSKVLRKSVAMVLKVLASTSCRFSVPAMDVLLDLCALNQKRVDGMDFDQVILALSCLGDPSANKYWLNLCGGEHSVDPAMLQPIIFCSFHLLYCEDGVVSRGAFKALKSLIGSAAEKSIFSKEEGELHGADGEALKWRKLLQNCISAQVRSGLTSSNTQARRFCILLLGEIVRCCEAASSPHLYGDLRCLVRDDEPDLDFFANITHVQLHRHARAFQRLRKMLHTTAEPPNHVSLTPHSLSNVLLPLATHPVYESKLKIEESLVLEAISTVGAISRYLSWSKYSSTLWTHLNQFDRHPEQEKYLIGLICAIIDGFHFDILLKSDKTEFSSVWKALETRIIPKTQMLITKEKVDKKGNKVKLLRSAVVLALLKLFNKFPDHLFRAKLPQLLTIICNALTSKDSNARDIARLTIAKMVLEMDMVYLADVIRDLAITLNEGYKLHVRSATIHTILLELGKVYQPSLVAATEEYSPPVFDKTVPAFMDMLQQDIFGMAQERKDAVGNHVSHVKEAAGSKSYHSIELIASMIQFKPSATSNVSSVHALIVPLLERLKTPDLSFKCVRRIKECLSRAVTGLLRNPTLYSDDLLPFVQSTLEMVVCKEEVDLFLAGKEDDERSDDEFPLEPIHVSGKTKLANETADFRVDKVAEWRPSTLNAPKTAKDAQSLRTKEQQFTWKVQDGASAPKLTGSSRYVSSGAHTKSLNDPAIVAAVTFSLQLLGSVLKKPGKVDSSNAQLDPFVPLLTTCICRSRDSDVILLSVRCLSSLLKADLLSLHQCSNILAPKALDLLTSSGSNQELLQASYKMLTFLINYTGNSCTHVNLGDDVLPIEDRDYALAKEGAIPLNPEQMQVLVSFLQGSLVDSDQHYPAIGLIKAIMSHRYVSSEFYDLMELALEQTTRNSSSSARDQLSKVFVNYFINYPLARERIEAHLRQVILNLNYEYTEGRQSAIRLVNLLVEKLPGQMLDERNHFFFLPLSLQLVNDESKDCREAIAMCLGNLLKRLSTESLQSLYNFIEHWTQGNNDLRRMSLQLYAIFVDARLDFVRRGDNARNLLKKISSILEERSENWECLYFALILIEKMSAEFKQLIIEDAMLWSHIVPVMINTHAWIRLASSRLVSNFLSQLSPRTIVKDCPNHFLLSYHGSLYQIARNLCFQLGSNEEEQNNELTLTNVKLLTWVIQAMKSMPELCFSDNAVEARNPIQWVMTRLCNIAKPKGTKRRQSVFKCFAAFATYCGDIAFDYLDLMLEPLHRSESETRNILDLPSTSFNTTSHTECMAEEAQLAKEVLHLLEEKCIDQNHFLKSYAQVKSSARDKKMQRKTEAKTDAVVDPIKAAKRRIEKQEQEKKRRKRRINERRQGRGASAKRRHFD